VEGTELILVLLAVVSAVTLLAERIRVPYPILMVIAGLALGLLPWIPRIELDPEVVLVLFLPPILFSAAYFLSPRELWRNVRPISLLAIGLVVATTLAVAAIVMVLAPQLGWPAALALGAIVSPPDAIAATAIARRLRLPRRLVLIFEGESLVNDATALTIYRLTVSAAVAGTALDLGSAATSFVVVAVGGAAVGLVVGLVATWLLSLLDDPPVEVLLSLLVPFAAYLPAEEALHVSGVLAVVTAGLIVGWRSPRVMSSETRILGSAAWKMVIFVVNGLAFLLIGLQLPTVTADLTGYDAGELIVLAAAVSATVILLRLAWVFPATYLPRWLWPPLARRDPSPSPRVVLILGWGGMRGAVSLAAALALPIGGDGEFPERGLVIFLAFVVILVTLIGQGLTLPALIRATHVVDDGSVEHEEVHARAVASQAALTRIEELRGEVPNHQPLLDQLRERYEHRGEHLVHEHRDDEPPASRDDLTPEEIEEMEHDQIRRAIIAAERLAILELRDTGEIGDDALRSVERDLDLDELRREA
jgi:CPA1 family monovalent cation:H+ antiporter